MRNRVFRLALLCALLMMGSCIENTIPYPYIRLDILSIEGEGFTQKSIDATTRVATITLDESTDIQNVNITKTTCTEGAMLSAPLEGVFDMRYGIASTLYLYQSYDWVVKAEQSMERYFKVDNQLGAEDISYDESTSTGTVHLFANINKVDISQLTVKSMKFDADEITTYAPTLESLQAGYDFTNTRRVIATTHGRKVIWYITIDLMEPVTLLTSIDLRSTYATLVGSGDTSVAEDCGFEYALSSAPEEWSYVAASSVADGQFSVTVEGLAMDTDYIFRAVVGEDASPSSDVMHSETQEQLPNAGFEDWHQSGKAWFPFLEGGTQFWGTGNEGSSLLGSTNISKQSSETAPGSSGVSSLLMDSADVLKFAAGNIFTGYFVGVNGTNGTINVGRPFTDRPVALRGWMKYTSGVVGKFAVEGKLASGEQDQGSILVALGDWTKEVYGKDATGAVVGSDECPISIDTRSDATFFNSNAEAIIAYGELYQTTTQDGWTEFEVVLDYRDLERKPTHIAIMGASSRYGDYFCGSVDSEMLLDDLELVYEP